MFGDLVGFTTLSETMDPEQVKQLVDECFARLAADITSFGGQVDKVLGDAIVALFGAPVAHEDDAERAVRAALKMQETIRALDRVAGVSLRMRIGVNTGEALVGAIRGDNDYTAMGDAVNTANRLQSAARPGTVLVGSATHEATSRVIRYERVGPVQVKGRGEDVDAYVALEPFGLPGERRGRSTSPLVGRDGELAVLRQAVDTSIAHRRAQLLLLLGDAGVGKTRLALELVQRVSAGHDALVLSGRCVPYGEANVWWPVAEAMRQALEVTAELSAEEVRARVVAGVSHAFRLAPEEAPVVRAATGLLHLLDHETSLRSLDPQTAFLEAGRSVRTYLQARAGQRPVVLWLADLHWADDVVLRMIDGLTHRLARLPFVLLASARFGLNERWSPQPGRYNSVVLSLDVLDPQAADQLLVHLLGPDAEPSLRNDLIGRSGGNPFFLEELAALVRDGRTVGGEVGELPNSVRGLVSARLDGLPRIERDILEDAAVLGRRGQVAPLRRMAEALHGVPDITEALLELADKDLLQVERVLNGEWSFRSDLVRDVVYGRITKAERARRHARIALHLEAQPEGDRALDTIAYHYRRAAELVQELGPVSEVPDDVAARAVEWLSRAARATTGSATAEMTARLYGQALALADGCSRERRAELLLERARASLEARRYAAARRDLDEALEVAFDDPLLVARARLCEGELAQRGGELSRAVELLEEAADRYRALGVMEGVAEASRIEGMTHLFAGRYEAAEACVRRALDVFASKDNRLGEAWARQNLAWISFVTGHLAEAESRIDDASAVFAELGDQAGIAWSRGLLAFVRMHQGRMTEADELAALALRDARERGDRWAEGMMLVLRASVALWSGRVESSVRRAEEASALFRTIDDHAGQQQATAVLGRALVLAGRVTEGFAAFADAVAAGPSGAALGLVQLLPTAAAAAAVAVGDPDEALRWLAGTDTTTLDPALVGHGDRLVALGLAHLQRGQVDDAVTVLEQAASGSGDAGADPNALAALALALAAAGGRGRAVAAAEAARASSRATYADRLLASVALALLAAGGGDEVAASEALDAAGDARLDSEDRVATAVLSLAAATVRERLGDPTATDARRRADDRVAALGVEGRGWVRAFELASR